MWVDKCLSISLCVYMCVWVGCHFSAEQQPTVKSTSLRLVQRLSLMGRERRRKRGRWKKGNGGDGGRRGEKMDSREVKHRTEEDG